MIYLIHGQNNVDSRRFLVRLKSNYQDIQEIPAKNLNQKIFSRKLKEASRPIFGGKSAVLIENFGGNWEILPANSFNDLDLILWSPQRVEEGKQKVKSFAFDQGRKATAFRLTDAILFRNEKEAQSLLLELLARKEPPEKIIGAMLRGVFLVYCAKKSLSGVSLPSFARKKIEEQSKNWTEKALKKVTAGLLSADLALRNGESASLVFSQFISRIVSLS